MQASVMNTTRFKKVIKAKSMSVTSFAVLKVAYSVKECCANEAYMLSQRLAFENLFHPSPEAPSRFALSINESLREISIIKLFYGF